MLAMKRKLYAKQVRIKCLQTLSCFMSVIPAVMITVSLVQRAIFVKLSYENKGNVFTAVHEFRRTKNHGMDQC